MNMVDSHFHVQLTAVMDVLLKTAVSDICALAESWFKSLHTEIARSKKENEDLRQKLQMMEQEKHQPAVEPEAENATTKQEKDDGVEVRDTDDSGCTVLAGTSTEDLAVRAQLWPPSSQEEQREKTPFCHICVKEVGCLKSHLEWHDQKFKCHICHRIFHNKVVFSRHLNMHTGFKHACDVCRKTFGSKSGLLKHISHHKRDLEKCKDCDQEFPTKQTLYSHREKTHTVPKQCPYCELTFSRNSNLKKHLQRHRDIQI